MPYIRGAVLGAYLGAFDAGAGAQTEQQIHDAIAAQLHSLAQAQRIGPQASDTITAAQWDAALHAFLFPASGNTPTEYEAAVATAIVHGGTAPALPSPAARFGLSDADYQAIRASGLSDADIQQLVNKDAAGMADGLQDYLLTLHSQAQGAQYAADLAKQQAFVPTTPDEWVQKYGPPGAPRFAMVNGVQTDFFFIAYPGGPGHTATLDDAWHQLKAAGDAAREAAAAAAATHVVTSSPAPTSSSSTGSTSSTSSATSSPPPTASIDYAIAPTTMPSDVAAAAAPIEAMSVTGPSGGISTGWLIAGAGVLGLGLLAMTHGHRTRRR